MIKKSPGGKKKNLIVFLPSEILLGVRVSSDGRGDLRSMLRNLDEFGVVVMVCRYCYCESQSES